MEGAVGLCRVPRGDFRADPVFQHTCSRSLISALQLEALNLLFEKYGKPPIA